MRQPMPHQQDGVQFWLSHNCRAGIAHEQGLGKTYTAILCMERGNAGRVMVVVPETLRIVWANEVRACSTRPVFIYSPKGDAPKQWLASPDGVMVIGYTMFTRQARLIADKAAPDMLVVDECHYVKNMKAQRTKAIRLLSRKVPKVLFLSGTPMVNRPIELFPVLNMLDPIGMSSLPKYGYTYCGAKRTPFGWDFSGASKLEQLHKMLSAYFFHRCTKAEALPDLPTKTRVVVPLAIDNASDYKAMQKTVLAEAVDWVGVDGTARTTMLTALTRINVLRQMAVSGIIAQAVEWVKDFIHGGDQKLVLFVHHRDVALTLAERLDALSKDGIRFATMTGEVSQTRRAKLVEEFQTGDLRLLICTMSVAGVGLTLTAASHVAFIETDWMPGVMLQCEDRVHRIGAKNAVTCHYLIAADTIAVDIVQVLHRKMAVLEQALDGRSKDEADANVFGEILHKLTA